ncbi:MAG TPA: septum formation initiator [Treponema sp.]|jgi:cell division protein FtsB|nr:septum formation initiator [Treponema sp.]HBD67914.1 septum formation initiator [Treponema sp.]
MIRFRLLGAVCAGTLFYVLLGIFCGRDGLWAYNQLLEQKRMLSTHAASIEKTHEELMLEKVALQKDPDVIAAYARRLGYVGEGEKLVKISGLAVTESRVWNPGVVLRHKDVSYVPESFCKMMGIVVAFMAYLVLFLHDYNHGYIQFPRKKKTFVNVKGLTVYDIS